MKTSFLLLRFIVLAAILCLVLFGEQKQCYTQEPPDTIEDVDYYTDSVKIKHKLHKHPLPLKIFGIKVGYATDKPMAKKFGEGTLDPDDGHGGSRYYNVPSLKVQMRYSIGVDMIIDYVAVTSAEYPFDYINDGKLIDIKGTYSASYIKLARGVGLNDSPEKIKSKYGVPNFDYMEGGLRIIIYMDSGEVWKNVTSYEATFTFKGDKLVRMSIYNGE